MLITAVPSVQYNSKDQYGQTALLLVAGAQERNAGDRAECIKELLNAGADPDVVDDGGQSALMETVKRGDVESSSLLVAANAGLDLQDSRGRSALMMAKTPECASLLIDAGANVMLKDDDGRGVLMSQIINNEVINKDHIIALLKSAGVRSTINDTDDVGFTSLMQASKKGLSDVVKQLLAVRGIEVDKERDEDGMTALMYAVESFSTALYLITIGRAKLGQTNKDGDTALSILKKEGDYDDDFVDLLKTMEETVSQSSKKRKR
jgi:ankyrin repeat protein